MAKKSSAQLDREIREALARTTVAKAHQTRRASDRQAPERLEQDQERWLEGEVGRAMLHLAGGPGRRVRITDLRREVGEVARDELDQALRAMSARGRIALFPLDDPHEIQPKDAADALDLSGVLQHVVYLTSRSS